MPVKQTQQTHCLPAFFILAFLFLASRLIAFSYGIHMDQEDLFNLNQALDKFVLSNDLLSGCWYNHFQTPGYNFILGLVFKLGGSEFQFLRALRIFYYLLSFTSVILLYTVLIKMGLSKSWSLILTVFYLFTPALMIMEVYPYYPILINVFILAMLYCLSSYFSSKQNSRSYWIWGFFLLLGGASLIRPAFHFSYVAVIGLILGLFAPWKKVVLPAAVAILLSFVPVIKNKVLYDYSGAATVLSCNLHYLTGMIPQETLEKEASAGHISTYYLKGPWDQHLEAKSKIGIPDQFRGIQVLEREYANTHWNLNQYYYIPIYKNIKKDAFYLLKKYPENYLAYLPYAANVYFLPLHDYLGFTTEQGKMERYLHFWNYLFNWQTQDMEQSIHPTTWEGSDWFHISISGLIVTLLCLIGYPLFLVYKKHHPKIKTHMAVHLVIWLSIGFFVVLGILLGNEEGMRFRFDILLFQIIGFGSAAQVVLPRTQKSVTKVILNNLNRILHLLRKPALVVGLLIMLLISGLAISEYNTWQRNLERVEDIELMNAAILEYKEQHGHYPIQEQWAGNTCFIGVNKRDYIPGIQLEGEHPLPIDPSELHNGERAYFYKSNGENYKLIAHFPENIEWFRKHYPYQVDLIRPYWAYGFWSRDAWNW